MRATKFILIACLVLTASSRVFAVSTIIQATTTNIKTVPFVISVRDEGTNKLFRVVVNPKGAGDGIGKGTTLSAYLDVFDGTNHIASRFIEAGKLSDAKAPLANTGVLYEFAVSTNYLDASKFSITYQLNDYPAFVGYWFYLKDFSNAK